MRIFTALLATKGRGRAPQGEPVPFQEILPLKLKAVVSGKGGKMTDVCCLHEMQVMFSCFKENEFQQNLCSKEIDNFQKCYTHHLTEKKIKTDRNMKGVLTPGDKNMSPKQINVLLRRHPNK